MKGNKHMEKFLNCAASSGAVTKLEYQFNKQTDVDKSIWYIDNEDFKANEWQKTTTVNTDDGTLSGGMRQSATLTSYVQTVENTIKEEYASTFLKRLHAESSVSDAHFRDLLSHGLNVRITTTFGDGSFVRETHTCCTITDFNEPFKQLSNADSEVTLNTQLNFEPTIVNVGVGLTLPVNIQPVSLTMSATATGTDVNVTLTNITDPSDLIEPTNPTGSEWKVALFNAITGELVGELENAGTDPFAFADVPAGEYMAIAYYSYAKEGSTVFYNAAKAQKVTVTA